MSLEWFSHLYLHTFKRLKGKKKSKGGYSVTYKNDVRFKHQCALSPPGTQPHPLIYELCWVFPETVWTHEV